MASRRLVARPSTAAAPFLIAVEQRVRGAGSNRRQFPSEIIGVLNAGIQALSAARRVREAVISPKGKAMTDRIDIARERMGEGEPQAD